jgi:uncharacterized membrane protein YkoI
MNKHLLVFAAAAALATGCQTENQLSMTAQFEDMPSNVQSIVRQEIGQSEIMDIDVERRTGGRVYEVTYMEGGMKQKLHVREDGSMLSADEAALFGWGDEAAQAEASTEEMSVRTEAAGAERPGYQTRDQGSTVTYKAGGSTAGASVNTSESAGAQATSTSRGGAQIQANASGTSADSDLNLGTKFGDVPAAVQQTIKREAAGAQVADIDKETRSGRTVYEVSFREPGLNPKLHIAQDGTLLTKQQASAFRNEADSRARSDYDASQHPIEAKSEVRGGAEALTEGPSAAGADVDIEADANLSDEPAGAEKDMKEMRLEHLPQNIQTAVRQHGGGAEVSTIKKTKVYEVHFKDASKGTLRIAEDGTVLSGNK